MRVPQALQVMYCEFWERSPGGFEVGAFTERIPLGIGAAEGGAGTSSEKLHLNKTSFMSHKKNI